jgi:hypothetical protein
MLINIFKIYTVPLSVQVQYSRLCPISSSFRYNGNCCFQVCWDDHVIGTEPLASNGSWLQSHYLAKTVIELFISWSLPSKGSLWHIIIVMLKIRRIKSSLRLQVSSFSPINKEIDFLMPPLSLCLYVFVSARAWFVAGVLFLFDIQGYIHHGAVSDEHEHCSPKKWGSFTRPLTQNGDLQNLDSRILWRQSP